MHRRFTNYATQSGRDVMDTVHEAEDVARQADRMMRAKAAAVQRGDWHVYDGESESLRRATRAAVRSRSRADAGEALSQAHELARMAQTLTDPHRRPPSGSEVEPPYQDQDPRWSQPPLISPYMSPPRSHATMTSAPRSHVSSLRSQHMALPPVVEEEDNVPAAGLVPTVWQPRAPPPTVQAVSYAGSMHDGYGRMVMSSPNHMRPYPAHHAQPVYISNHVTYNIHVIPGHAAHSVYAVYPTYPGF